MTRSPADDAGRHPFAHLAGHLTALRGAARLTQRALAEAAHISRGAVQRAESGTAPPTPSVLDAYLRACGAGPADQDKARRLRARGRTAQRDRLRELKAPSPALVHDERDLGLLLAQTYERAGAPRLPLPRTTAWRIVNRKGLPASREQLITFLTACGIHPPAQRPYLDAYHHVIAQRGTRPAPPRGRRRQVTQRIVRSHPLPLARGGTDTGALLDIDFDRLAAALRPVLEALAAYQSRYYDADRLAAGIKPAVDALAAQSRHYDYDRLAAGIQPAVTALALMFRSASREAHRNGTTPPDWITATSLITHGVDLARPDTAAVSRPADDHGTDLVVHTADGGTQLYQAAHSQRPGTPPALPPALVPQPPPATPAARAA
ncbi:helix-turn-helix domain-containing protein [Streptomyces blattellae]|uniref:helix-turn-helix domain-containing protein n=1 Tax=Streptomyces blattellae TaxID=2569855 RepID=UPI0012B70E22|nr:helix-turn-helix transcriptional regulator [Streptomyces blattellae]